MGLCGKNCDNCIFKEKYCGGCSLCEASLCNKNCNRCCVLCAERPESAQLIKKVIRSNIKLRSNNKIELPVHLPILPDRLRETPQYECMPVIAIHGGNMFSSNGEKISKLYSSRGYAAALNLNERTEAILEFYVRDRTLEGFYDNRKNIYDELKSMRLKAVIAPNFSVYEDAPRMDHIYNINRSKEVYNELIDQGFMAIPDVSWYNKTDLDIWCNEINKNSIKIIAFSFQVVDVQLKASTLWKAYLLGFKYMCSNIDPDVKIIIAGMTSARRIEEAFRAANGHSLHILNQSAFIQSRRGMLSEKRIKEKNLTITMDDIFKKNIDYFNTLYLELNNKYVNQGGKKCRRLGEAIL